MILIHGLLGLALWKSDFLSRISRKIRGSPAQEITDHYRQMICYHARVDPTIPDGAVVFIGDSLIEGICLDSVVCPSVNYGIGRDTTLGVLGRIEQYQSLKRASAVVLAVGINDLQFRDNDSILTNYARILAAIPEHLPVVCCGASPIDPSAYNGPSAVTGSRTRNLNSKLRGLCATEPRFHFVAVGDRLVDEEGNLSAALHGGDGIHLNRAGSQIWIEEMRKAIRSINLAKIPIAAGN